MPVSVLPRGTGAGAGLGVGDGAGVGVGEGVGDGVGDGVGAGVVAPATSSVNLIGNPLLNSGMETVCPPHATREQVSKTGAVIRICFGNVLGFTLSA